MIFNIWSFLNKPFTIWILSSVTISLVSFLYQKNEERQRQEFQRKATIEALDLEISSRLKFFFINRENKILIDEALLILESPSQFDFPTGVYQKYEERNLRSLILELRSLVSEEEKNELEKPIHSTYELAEIYLLFNKTYRNKPTVELKYKILNNLNEQLILNFNLDRWKTPTSIHFPDLQKITGDNYLQKALDEFSAIFGDEWLEESLRDSIE